MHPLEHVGRLRAGDTFVKHDPKRVDIGPRPLIIGPHILLDRGIGRRVERDSGIRRLGRLEPRRAEIDQHRAPVLVDEDVRRLDVAVKDADAVRPLKPFGDRPEQRHQACLGEALALLQQFRQ